jgi:hypothetical protein
MGARGTVSGRLRFRARARMMGSGHGGRLEGDRETCRHEKRGGKIAKTGCGQQGHLRWHNHEDRDSVPHREGITYGRRMPRRRSAFPMTLTDDSAMAAAAMIGESNSPNTGYSTPAATGTPAAL